MSAPAQPVPLGTAEQLARVHHFRQLTDALPDAHELDPVLGFLIGRVCDRAEVLEHLGEDLDQLWSLLTEDFDDDQLDELSEAEWAVHSFSSYEQEVDHRRAVTRERLADDIEGYIGWQRLVRVERDRAERAARLGGVA